MSSSDALACTAQVTADREGAKVTAMSETVRRRIRIAMVVAPVLFALYIVWSERTAILPFVLGMALAYLIAPAVNWIAAVIPFRKTKPYLARAIAILVLYAAVAGAAVGACFLIVPQAADEIDQFFDEPQWESYRRLGAHIGDNLFA